MKANSVVTRGKVQDVLSRREQIASLKKELAELESEEMSMSQEVINLLKVDARIEDMPYLVEVSSSEHRYPAYKAVLEAEKGAEFVLQVLNNTVPRVTEKLVIKAAATSRRDL